MRELVRFRPDAVRDVYLTGEAGDRYPEIVDAAQAATRWVHEVSPEVARAMSGEAQGVLAVAEEWAVGGSIDGVPLGEGLTRAGLGDRGVPGVVVVLVQAQDPGNVGTIVRTADAMGAVGVVLTAGSVDPRSPKVVRSSAGSVFHLPVVTGVALDEVVAALHEGECVVVGTSGRDGSVSLSGLLDEAGRTVAAGGAVGSLLGGPHAWVMGNEARGLSEAEEDACDVLVSIPMSGDAESLNVASAAAMCLFASQHARVGGGSSR